MDTTTATPLRSLVELRLASADVELDELVAARRGIGRSWKSIRDEIHELTDLTFSYGSLREWFPEHRERP